MRRVSGWRICSLKVSYKRGRRPLSLADCGQSGHKSGFAKKCPWKRPMRPRGRRSPLKQADRLNLMCRYGRRYFTFSRRGEAASSVAVDNPSLLIVKTIGLGIIIPKSPRAMILLPSIL